jgi:hypothetical protein
MTLPRSYYYRMMHQSSRPTRLKIDYPLVFFSFFSRIALGMGIIGGIWQLLGNDPRISSLILQMSFVTGLLCMIIAQFHATDKRSLFHVFTNRKSLLTWEISSLILFLFILVVNSSRDYLGVVGHIPSITLATLIIFLAFSSLILTGVIYNFYSHPVWDTIWITLITLASSMVLAILTVSAWSVLFFPYLHREILWFLLMLVLFFLTGEGLALIGFIQHWRRVCRKRALPIRHSEAFYIYLGVNFYLPFILLAVGLFAERALQGCLLFVLLLICKYGGVFLERYLFFHVEKPNFFLSAGQGLAKGGP